MSTASANNQVECELCQSCTAACVEVPHYRVRICPACQAQNRDGWCKEHEAKLFHGLGRSGLLIPDRNQKGLLPFQYQPPSDYAL